MIATVTNYPDAIRAIAYSLGCVGVAWAIAWAAVHTNRDDPFWNKKRTHDTK